MSGLKLFLLGQPRFERDGQPLRFDTRKNVALVAYLALGGGFHSRETLIALLWPEHDPRRARGILRRNLSVLKKAIGDEWIVVEGEEVGTDPGADFWLDVDRFRHLLAICQAHEHSSVQGCPQCLDALAQAVDLYRGDLLEGFSLADSAVFDEWQFFEAESLRQVFSAALQDLVLGHGARAEYEPAIRYARRWLSVDPLHEPAHRHLMQLYARSGQHAAAMRQYHECVRLLNQELDAAPGDETAELYQRIQQSSSQPLKHNLPVPPTPFVGRTQLLKEVRERLDDRECRLLALLGPGGSGKTRLAIRAAELSLPSAQLGRFPDGIFFIPLAALGTVEAVVPTVAQILGLPLLASGRGATSHPHQQLLDYLQHKRLLLILDNAEHLLGVGGVPGLVSDVLQAAPGVCILVTSRTQLDVQGEHLIPVGGMDYPELLPRTWVDAASSAPVAGQIVSEHSAIALFLSAARRMQPGYALTGDSLPDVIRICRLVEGMPLGIVLAASWVQVLPAAEIANQIAHSLDFLETELRDVPDRHRSMRAVLDHSWTMLSAGEQGVVQRLSVFQGEFALQAAQQITGVSLSQLRALTSKSLVHLQPSGRYHLHELVRQYAEQRLRQAPSTGSGQIPLDWEAVRDQHCAWYTSALQRWSAGLKSPRQQDVLAEMDAEIENARAAWNWAVEQSLVSQLVQALDGLCHYYQRRGRLEEGNAACLAVKGSILPPAGGDRGGAYSPKVELTVLLSRALTWQGLFTRLTGYAEAAGPLLDRSIGLLDALDSSGQDVQAQRAFALLEMGRRAFDLDRDHARRCLEQSLDLYQALGDRWGAAETLYMLGFLADGLGNYDRARQLLNKSLAVRQALGDRQGTAQSLVLLGLIALRIGQLEQGEALLRQSIGQLRELGERVDLADGLHYLGFATFLQGRFEEGIVLQEECLALADDLALGHPRGMALHALGNYYAMLGKYEKARTYATSGLAHARTLSDAYVIGSTCLVLGLISLAQQDYGSSQRWVEQSLAAYRGMGQQDGQSWSLTSLGYAALGLGNLTQARLYLGEALQTGASVNSFLSTILALSGVALWMARTGEVERAVELWALLSRYPLVSNAPFFQDIVGRFIDAAAVDLPPEMVASARERGMAGDLYAVAKAFLL